MRSRMRNRTNTNKKILTTVVLFGFFIVGAILFFMSRPSKEKSADLKLLSQTRYDSAFLSMFPIDNFEEDDYAYYRAMTLVKTSYNIPDYKTLNTYMKRIAKSGNTVHTIYLGVRPDKLSSEKLLPLLQKYPNVTWEIILAYPSLDYWKLLSEEDAVSLLQDYRDFSCGLTASALPNTHLYSFCAAQWLISNPSNYTEEFLTTQDISRTVMLHADTGHDYLLTAENITDTFDSLTQLVASRRASPAVYPDLSRWDIVFFGDSVIGNYNDSTSIPGVLAALTNANVYNCGWGGTSASYNKETAESASLTEMTAAFIRRDTDDFPVDSQACAGLNSYYQSGSPDRQLCFVLHYGLNDYYTGAPVATQDPYDINSFEGALRAAVNQLKKAYPDACILLSSPNFTSYFSNGTQKQSETGGIATDYVNAVLEIAAENHCLVLDNYTETGINAENHSVYLGDGCHPNERGRFIIGSLMAQKLGQY